jgi:hypothetical protein
MLTKIEIYISQIEMQSLTNGLFLSAFYKTLISTKKKKRFWDDEIPKSIEILNEWLIVASRFLLT